MLAKIQSFGLFGMVGYPVQVEVDVTGGLPAFELVGLPDAAVKESRERVRSALKNSGFTYPPQRITVNLAPADVRKEGPMYDLPMAIGLLAASERIAGENAAPYCFLGELSLDGALRPISGVLAMAIEARKQGYTKLILPEENAEEAFEQRRELNALRHKMHKAVEEEDFETAIELRDMIRKMENK